MSTSEIKQAVDLLRAGKLVAFPTETVYGLGADARNDDAIRKIFRVKERPYDHPLIVHVGSLDQVSNWAKKISDEALELAHAFWPGPLTLILKKQDLISDLITGWQDTIGIRIPAHPIAQALLLEFADGIAAPSANKFTHISPTTAAHVREELGEEVDLILDGGPCEVGLESTIVDVSGKDVRILRPGMITAQMIADVLHMPIQSARTDSARVRTAGMHHLHYAPATKTKQLTIDKIQNLIAERSSNNEEKIAIIVHSMQPIECINVHWIQLANKPAQYAHDLYHTLRTLDTQQFRRIIIEAIPMDEAWEAIRDRVTRASAK